MRIRLLTLLVLVPLCLCGLLSLEAQEFPFFAWDNFSLTSSNTLPDTGKIKLRWRIATLTNSTVNTWVDDIEGNCMYQTNNPPISNQFGVKFLNQYLWTTNINMWFGTNALLMILDHPVSTGSAGQIWITEDFSGRIFVDSVPTLCFRDASIHELATLTTNGTYDVLFVNDSNNVCNVYTNGVRAIHPAGIANGQLFNFNQLGMHRSAFEHYNGGIKEIIVFTGTNFNSAGISNLHYYSTNTYRFTP